MPRIEYKKFRSVDPGLSAKGERDCLELGVALK